MSRAAKATLLLGSGAALALLAMGAAVRAWRAEPARRPGHDVLVRLGAGLLAFQGGDGAFDPAPDDPDLPEVFRTVSHALATAALGRLEEAGCARDLPGLAAARRAAVDVLVLRQRPGGGFGALAPGANNPWPGVQAAAGATYALSVAGRPSEDGVLARALAGLERTAAYRLEEGWTRGLVALALHAAWVAGAGESLLGQDPRSWLVPGRFEEPAAPDDATLSEAVLRAVRDPTDGLGARLVATLAEEDVAWAGERTDLRTAWMETWLARRSAGGARVVAGWQAALGEAAGPGPCAALPGGWYADPLTRTALAVLVLAEAAVPLGRGG